MKKMGCFLILSLLLSGPGPARDLQADSQPPETPAAVSMAEAPAQITELPADSNFQPILVAQNGSQEGYSHSTWTYQSKPPAEQTSPPKRSEAAVEPAEITSRSAAPEERAASPRRRPVQEEPKVTVIQLPAKKEAASPPRRNRTAEAEALPTPQKSLTEMYHPELSAGRPGQAPAEAAPQPERRRSVQEEPPKKTTLTYRNTNNILPQRAEPTPAAAPAMTLPTPAPQDQARVRRKADPAVQPPPAPPVTPSPAVTPGLPPDQDLAQAYQVFDQKYMGSLGKTRRELKDWWGFPLVKLGENEHEVAYGFRQRGIINVPPPVKGKGRKSVQIQPTSYYASGDMMPTSPDQRGFACLMVLWVDQKGKGVVVDGDAVGDCFSVEALTHKPVQFER